MNTKLYFTDKLRNQDEQGTHGFSNIPGAEEEK